MTRPVRVQVTADGVAVIFHDDYIVHGSLCDVRRSLVRQVTYEAFTAMGGPLAVDADEPSPLRETLMRRFKCAKTHALLPGDREWDCEEEDSMPTLAQLFAELPPSLGFNIEVKIATSPALEFTPAGEVSRLLDVIMPVVEAGQGARPLMFSSFDPDVVAALAQRACTLTQPAQVWLLSTCGEDWHIDARRMSVDAALAFARKHALMGVVLNTAALARDCGAVRRAQDAALLVMTYGARNDDAEWVLQQRYAGVAGVIVDDVPTVVTAVRGASDQEASVSALLRAASRSSIPDLVYLTGTAC